MKMLIEGAHGDRLMVLNEIEKLIIFLGDRRKITEQDVVQCYSDAAVNDISLVLYCYCRSRF